MSQNEARGRRAEAFALRFALATIACFLGAPLLGGLFPASARGIVHAALAGMAVSIVLSAVFAGIAFLDGVRSRRLALAGLLAAAPLVFSFVLSALWLWPGQP